MPFNGMGTVKSITPCIHRNKPVYTFLTATGVIKVHKCKRNKSTTKQFLKEGFKNHHKSLEGYQHQNLSTRISTTRTRNGTRISTYGFPINPTSPCLITNCGLLRWRHPGSCCLDYAQLIWQGTKKLRDLKVQKSVKTSHQFFRVNCNLRLCPTRLLYRLLAVLRKRRLYRPRYLPHIVLS